jgi:thymidylate kinase
VLVQEVENQIKSKISDEAFAKIFGAMRVNATDAGIKIALEEQVHIAFARFIDLTYQYSMDNYNSEEFVIACLVHNPITLEMMV